MNTWTMQLMEDVLLFKTQKAKIICSFREQWSHLAKSQKLNTPPAKVHEVTNKKNSQDDMN